MSWQKKKGAEFFFNSTVQKIIHNKGEVSGVLVNGEIVEAPLVVSNGDVYFTYKHLLSDGDKAKKILKQERSSSAVIFYWGINKNFPPLELHNIFLVLIIKRSLTAFSSTKKFSMIQLYMSILLQRWKRKWRRMEWRIGL